MRLLKILLVVAFLFLVKDLWSTFNKRTLPDSLFAQVQFVQGSAPAPDMPVLLEFWATWCGPCRQSIPHLNTLDAQYRAKGLQVIGLTNENSTTVQAFMKQVPMNYGVGIDHALHRQFGISSIPHAFLFGANHKLIWDGHPLALTEADLKKAF